MCVVLCSAHKSCVATDRQARRQLRRLGGSGKSMVPPNIIYMCICTYIHTYIYIYIHMYIYS